MNKQEIQNTNRSAPSAKIIRLGDGAFITVVMAGESLTLRASDSTSLFEKALQAFKDQDWDQLYEAMRPVKSYVEKVDGVTITSEGVFFDGEQIHSVLSQRIMDFAMAGIDHKPLCMFLQKLMNNPSRRAVKELYTFLEHQNLPITENGNFLAYKGLQEDYYSITTGTAKLLQGKVVNGKIYNGINAVIEMKRNDVDDNKSVGCSYGLHAGTMEYATSFARGRCVIVEINPADVVSIPEDCNFQKLRTCKYKVVGEFEAPLRDLCYESNFIEDDEIEDYDDFEDLYPSFSTPNSTWIDYVEYDMVNNYLNLYLKKDDTICLDDVPLHVFEEFNDHVLCGGSAGEFYHSIKDKYQEI